MHLKQEDIFPSLIGGLFIGLACTLNYALYGRQTNVAGIFNSLIRFSKRTGFFWKFCFFVGLISGPQYFYWKYGRDFTYNKQTYTFFDTDNFAIKHLSLFGWVLGGVLVGFGTRMSKGCTSGHFICGIPSG
jgi:uncharacterized membrane protein YedE/YeeE